MVSVDVDLARCSRAGFSAVCAVLALAGIATEARANPVDPPPPAVAGSPAPVADPQTPRDTGQQPAARATAPGAPVAPVAPVGPVAPVAPIGPVAPVALEVPERRRVRPVGVLLRIGVEYGGDTVKKIMSSQGTDMLSAGGQVAFGAGVLIHPQAAWTLEATLGYKFERLVYTSGTAELTRFPMDVIASLRTGDVRAGLGVTAHLAPMFSCNVPSACVESVPLDVAYGLVSQIAYGLHGRGSWGIDLALRVTFIRYTGDGVKQLTGGDQLIDGRCVGAFIGGWL
jgi:hypothetical protein